MAKKRCSKCDRRLSVNEFNWRNKAKGIRHSQCKTCLAKYKRKHYEDNRDAYIGRAKAWKKKNHRKSRYGLDPEDEAALIARFGGLCWACQERPATAVDHDHNCCTSKTRNTCGECVRGMLCFQCNSGIGLLGDSVEGLTTALRYLREVSLTALHGKRSSSSGRKKS